MELRDRRALVVGLGKSGIAAAELLLLRGATVRAADRDPLAVRRPAVQRLAERGAVLDCGPHREGQLADADLVVLSPGVPASVLPAREARAAGVPVIGELELGARTCSARLVGITGSNGKSTTTTLLARMLAASGVPAEEAGNIGRPLCDLVLRGDPGSGGVACVEVSSFQAETLSEARFAAAGVLNVAPDHLDRYDDVDQYAAAKLRLLDRVVPDGVAVLAADDARVSAAAGRVAGRVLWFGRGELPGDGARLGDEGVTLTAGDEPGRLFAASDCWSRAPHDLANAAAAALLALAMGATRDGVLAGLRGFTGLPHRREVVPTEAGPSFVNDSKATNVAAAVASIEASPPRTVVILGGRHKGGDLTPLAAALAAREAQAVLVGEASDDLERALAGSTPTTRAGDLGEAVAIAAARAGAEGTVLLAPACASFDMFASFEERGRRFRAEVLARHGGTRAGGVTPSSRGGCAA